MCMSVLTTCMSVYHGCALHMASKRGIDSLGQELQTVSRWFVDQDGLWESNLAHLEEQPKLITIFPVPVFISCKL